MSEIPSTLTEQQWQEIVEYKDKPNVMAPLWNHQKLLIKEVEFLRGLIGDLSQDGALEVYNTGLKLGKLEGKVEAMLDVIFDRQGRIDVNNEDGDETVVQKFGSEVVSYLNDYYVEAKEHLKDHKRGTR